MSTITVTFVQATFDLATFVHISHISAVTEPILIKLFWPWIFLLKINLDPNSFKLKIVLGKKKLFDPILLNQTFLGPKTFCTFKFLRSNIFWIFATNIFLNFFFTKCFWPKLCLLPNLKRNVFKKKLPKKKTEKKFCRKKYICWKI